MKRINNYITEKLHIDKKSKNENPYKGMKFENIISDIMYQIYRTSMDIKEYTVESENNKKVNVKTDPDYRMKYPRLRDKILDELGEYYNMNIYWHLANSTFIIEYEELD